MPQPRVCLVVLLLSCSPAFAQGVGPSRDDDAGKQKVVLQEPAGTVKEAMERRQAAMAEADKAMEAARAKYAEAEAAANREAVADLTQIARRAIADGALARAADAWESVLRMDPENRDAMAFFRTIGRENIVQKIAAEDGRKVWRYEGSKRPRFILQPDGTWIEFLPDGGKIRFNEVSRTDFVVVLDNPSSGVSVRIHDDRFYHRGPHDPDDAWKSSPVGSWD